MIDPLLVSLGLGVGTLVGLTGVGGGALLTPLLIIVVGVRPVIAIGTDLAFAALTKLVGAYQHTRCGTINRQLVARLALGSVPGALLGSLLVRMTESLGAAWMDALLTRMLGVALMLAALASLWRASGLSWGTRQRTTNPGAVVTALLGGIIGLLVGCTSIGAGSLLMAAFAFFYRALPLSQAVGADVLHGAILAIVAAIAHGAAGHIDVLMVGNLLIGSLPGVLLGSWLCTRLPQRPLRVGIATMLAVSGARLF